MFLGYSPTSIASTVQAQNPYYQTPNCRAHIILSHPTEPHQLLLSRGESDIYSRNTSGHLSGDGRSVTGAVRSKGTLYLADESVCNFSMDTAMLEYFERLLIVQRSSLVPVTVQDRWVKNRYKNFNALISIGDSKWLSLRAGPMFLVQFSLMELID